MTSTEKPICWRAAWSRIPWPSKTNAGLGIVTAAYNHGGRWQDPRGALRDAAEALGEPRAGPVDKGDGKG